MLHSAFARTSASALGHRSPFREEKTFEQRREEANTVFRKYPSRIPIICERGTNCTQLPALDKRKYLVPNDLTVAQFIYVIRKRMSLDSARALFVLAGGSIPTSTTTIGSLHTTHKDPDGFLYMQFVGENTFGSPTVLASQPRLPPLERTLRGPLGLQATV